MKNRYKKEKINNINNKNDNSKNILNININNLNNNNNIITDGNNKKEFEKQLESIMDYTDDEINDLSYDDALQNDKRTYCKF